MPLAGGYLLVVVAHGSVKIFLRERAAHLFYRLVDLFFNGPHIRVGIFLAKLDPGAGLVDDVDGFIGQESVADIPSGLVDGCGNGFVGVPDLMEALVTFFDAVQNPGKLADLIVVAANPLADIENVRKLQMVLKEGKVVADHRG